MIGQSANKGNSLKVVILGVEEFWQELISNKITKLIRSDRNSIHKLVITGSQFTTKH